MAVIFEKIFSRLNYQFGPNDYVIGLITFVEGPTEIMRERRKRIVSLISSTGVPHLQDDALP
jgi:hypothetical protein